MPEPTRSELEALWNAARSQEQARMMFDEKAYNQAKTMSAEQPLVSTLKLFVWSCLKSNNPRLKQLALNIVERVME